MKPNIALNAEESVISALSEKARELGFTYQVLDSRTELDTTELPDVDVLGLFQFAITEHMSDVYEVGVTVGVSTISDDNLFRLRRAGAAVFDMLQANQQIGYRDIAGAQDGTEAPVTTWMQSLAGATIMPTNRVQSRPFRFIQATLALNPNA